MPILLLTLCAALAPALQDRYPAAAVAALPEGMERPRIDGDLTDRAWQIALPLGPLYQVEPVAGGPPSEDTVVRVLHDDRSVFVALECLDRDPAGIRDTQRSRDAVLDPDDRVELFFDTFHDHRNAFWFQISPGGSKGDGLITRNGQNFNKEWDGIWYGKARVTARGWQAEIEIPAQTLNFDAAAGTWGFNLRRFIRRRNEEVRWASPTPRINFFAVADAGSLTGMQGMHQGLGLDVVPFVVGDAVRDRENSREYLRGDVGVDVFYRVTPSAKASVSVNTDFAETEVDERQVNLTRFPLFFPEQRDFFLEDSGVFFFGPSGGNGEGQDVIPFFSRRIGLDASGREVPLLASVKGTVQTESFRLGALDVQTEDRSRLEGKNLAVVRFSKNLFAQSDAGILVTRGNPTADPDSLTYGADFNYRTSDFLGDRNLQYSAYLLRTATEGQAGDDLAYQMRAAYPNDVVDLSATWLVVEDAFQPALGFVRRDGIKKYDASFRYRPRLGTRIRQLQFLFRPTLITDTGNHLETGELEFEPLGIILETGDEVHFTVERVTEVLDQDFQIQSGVIIPADRYDFTRYAGALETTDSRVVELDLEYAFGPFFDGTSRDLDVAVNVRPFALVNLGIEHVRNDVDLPGGDFVVKIWRARLDFQFTPELSWFNFVQYDNVSDLAGWNSRLWYILKPGHDLYFVVNQGWEYGSGHVAPTTTQLTAKVAYTLRF